MCVRVCVFVYSHHGHIDHIKCSLRAHTHHARAPFINYDNSKIPFTACTAIYADERARARWNAGASQRLISRGIEGARAHSTNSMLRRFVCLCVCVRLLILLANTHTHTHSSPTKHLIISKFITGPSVYFVAPWTTTTATTTTTTL